MKRFLTWVLSEPKRSRTAIILVCLAVGFLIGWTIGHFVNA